MTRRKRTILGFAIAVCAPLAYAVPYVDLTLVAPWQAPNLLVEMAETVGMDNSTLYFKLLDDFSSLTTDDSQKTVQQIYSGAIDRIALHQAPFQMDILKMGLALHIATPRIEAYHQYYQQAVIPTIADYQACSVWAQLNQQQFCEPSKLEAYIRKADILPQSLLPFDHVFGPPSGKPVILYTSEFSSDFAAFHSILTRATEKYEISYVLRYKPATNNNKSSSRPLYLSGYGVELALKNTDYLVIDDRAAEENTRSIKSTLTGFGKKISQRLFEETKPTIEPLTPKEIRDLALKATQFVALSENPLSSLTQLSQDFPKYAQSISQIELEEKFRSVNDPESPLHPGLNAMWLNGLEVDMDKVDPFFFIRALQTERKLMDKFQSLGINASQALDILSHEALVAQSANTGMEEIYDVRDSAEQPTTIWWNDLEKDKRYKEWTSNLYDMLRPVYPGQLRAIRRNVYNLLMIEDLSTLTSLNRIKDDIQHMIKQGTPIRFGIMPLVDADEYSASTITAKLLHYVITEYGKSQGMTFLNEIANKLSIDNLKSSTPGLVEEVFTFVMSKAGKPKSGDSMTFEDVLDSRREYAQRARAFAKRMGVSQSTNVYTMFLNGKYLEYDDTKALPRILLQALNEQTQLVAGNIYMGQIRQTTNVYEFLLTQPYVAPSRNPYIIVTEDRPLHMLPVYEPSDSLKYLYYVHSGAKPTVNVWVIANFNKVAGVKLALEAMSFLENNEQARVALIHNTADTSGADVSGFTEKKNVPFSSVLYQYTAQHKAGVEDLKKLFAHVLQDQSAESSSTSAEQIKIMAPGSPIVEAAVKVKSTVWDDQCNALTKMGMPSNFSGIIVNGRMVGPIDADADFSKEDYDVLWQVEMKDRAGPVLTALESLGNGAEESNQKADMVMKITSIIEIDKANTPKNVFEGKQTPVRTRPYHHMNPDLVHLTAGDSSKDAFIEIGVLLNPVSETAQKWSGFLETLSQIHGIHIDIYLNPHPKLEEIPIKRFYRYVFDSELHFDSKTGALETPAAYFADLPPSSLYTLGVDTINAWHVTVKEANMDLDNILLETLGAGQSSVSAVYKLEHILIEGHCIDAATQAPPRGLQFVLGTDTDHSITDTIVMANLGYFQLKAHPGIWNLSLREGRSSQVYHIENIGTEGRWVKGHEQANKLIPLTSFEGVLLFPQVRKNPGREHDDVLEEESTVDQQKTQTGFWSSMTNKLFGKNKNEQGDNKEVAPAKPRQADINIFSVASGQLYERFLSIMIASVMEHTKSTVKFWFIENFLSPSFKNFVPEMAKEYGFDYEMVTYNWPSWLRSQKEKQRTIWGYKILFLDVLFPLDVDKVIFVDADQIVRTDLQELVDLDLHGAPYGYTPFCSDRHEMDGFRFWNHGYWKGHLAGRPYHISALYVVDLVRFRQLAAGDRLRAQYQQLSADPNSLANLDQDLPNNMQHIVPIYSLPQEWLWCETWCSDESLKTAKTIDLCNNPLTKEPKLDRARRQVPEWEAYDEQIHKLRKKVAKHQEKEQKETPTASTPAHPMMSHAFEEAKKVVHDLMDDSFEDIIDAVDDLPSAKAETKRTVTHVKDEL
ncbi:UDP-glucose:glycoprotein glucosyltransferase-domain-containing protein [Radiomyces spectabilis]|uniref:UDP-glucose:glycoprotein glucosyltransferase-domain-containing protein n=1 Tax=Radiomyces spectabilis TaxID=64574 RepID=UPI00221F6684|nr:UDP-glucose:glycoprotein glucosyltransferase-domain-containing protein [Radiomyces spectabilis]KAI8384821.1 UDP-glucose:glycoprotein glucosyltransferase-domain-containing protein [Radiomyces spectabilis]